MTLAQGQGAFVPVSAWGKRRNATMDFRTYRPQRGFGRSERSLAKIAEELTRFLTKAQRSLTYDTLHLSSRQRETLASLLVECAEDLAHDIGIWRSLEAYNRDFFGTPLPCVLQPDEAMDADPLNPKRIQFLLWTLYAELEPGLILAPNHQDLARLALWIAEFLSARLARLRYDSAVQTFLTTPHMYGWDVKRKLVWMGQHSYLFRLPCAHYVRDHGGTADIPTLDDFLCQETTHWSGLGVIDILAAILDITDDQRRDLRRWYERHMAYFRVVSLREPSMDVLNLLNEQPYTIHVGTIGDTFQVDDVVFGSLVPWDGVWYWSGVQQKYAHVTDEVMQQIKGRDVSEEESDMIRQFLYADAISPQFVRKLIQDYGDASIATAFLVPQECDTYYVEYLLRRYKGHFYRKRYPSLTIVDI
jgi:Protein of unknown function (DUF3843)